MPIHPPSAAHSLTSEQLSVLVESSTELHLLVSAQGRITYASSAARRLLGFTPDQLVGQPISSLLHPEENRSCLVSLQQRVAQSAVIVTERCRFRSRDGSWKWFELTARNSLNDPAIEAIVLHCLEISDVHRMEAERQVISDIVHALNQTSNLDQLLAQIHQALKKVLYAENCFV